MAKAGERVELVIFDCDGILVDSEPIAVRVEARLITDLGWPVTEADVVDRFVGRSESYMLDEIEANVGRLVPMDRLQGPGTQVITDMSMLPGAIRSRQGGI